MTFQSLFSIRLIVTVSCQCLQAWNLPTKAARERERKRARERERDKSCIWKECRRRERLYLSYIFSAISWEVRIALQTWKHVVRHLWIQNNNNQRKLPKRVIIKKVIFLSKGTMTLIHSRTFWFTLLLMITNNNIMESFVRYYGYFSHQITF